MMFRIALLLPWLVFLAPHLVVAASSDWLEVEGGKVRIVTEDFANTGPLRGALEIHLEPGWKTYWLDPGEWGVPPQIELADGAPGTSVTIRFPPPKHISDGDSIWAGYDEPVFLALEFPVKSAEGLSAEIFLGICQTICIPVAAQLEIVSHGRSDPLEAEIIHAAFARLPQPAGKDFAIAKAEIDAGNLEVQLALPDSDMAAELFIADDGEWKLGMPEEVAGDPDRRIVPILAQPDHEAADLFYTLVGERGAVEGRLRFDTDER